MMKRISLSLLVIAALSILVTSASFALFTAQAGNQNNTFSSGEVTLGEPAGTAVNVENIVPGDSDSVTYSVEYIGNVPAWLGVEITTSGDLFTCDDGDKFDVTVSDGTTTYALDGGILPIGIYNNGGSVTMTTSWDLDLEADDDCENRNASVSLEFYAVQAEHNTNGTNTGPVDWLND